MKFYVVLFLCLFLVTLLPTEIFCNASEDEEGRKIDCDKLCNKAAFLACKAGCEKIG
uniref:Venom protein n=1 Tax=Hadrurus spadix TaxID=141984 RepID=A0A1W7R981_9SCOR